MQHILHVKPRLAIKIRNPDFGLVGGSIAIIPSFGLPACRSRKVAMSGLIDPVVNLEFHQIASRGKKLPPATAEFTAFLKIYIARWAGRAGVL